VKPRSFRQSMAWLHGWSGLVLGWLLFAIAASGTASVFKNEISDWMRPEVTAHADPIEALATALAYLHAAAPNSPSWYLTAPDARASTTLALFQVPKGVDGKPVWHTRALDPVTGRPDGIRDTLGGEFLYRFHFELQLPYPWGRMIASAAGMLLLVTLIAGIITHKRMFADFFTLRPDKGKRSWLDLHNALGVFALPFHLMISLTGVLTLITLTLPWGASTRAIAELSPGFITRPTTHRPAPAADSRTMLRDAIRRFGNGHIGSVAVDNPGDAAAVLRISRNDADQLADGAATATYAMATGRPIAFYAEKRPAKRTYDVLYGLHLGRFAPTFAHWLYFVCGLLLTATIASGLVLWTRSRAGGTGFGHLLVARLTVGAVSGMPLAIAAFFWANRLLPAGMPFRADAEVQWFFGALGIALIVGLTLRPRWGWIALMALAAAGWSLLPLLSALTTGRNPALSIARRDWIFLGFDLVALLLGIAAAAIALSVTRHRPAPARVRGPA